jgi:hypothetical protein
MRHCKRDILLLTTSLRDVKDVSIHRLKRRDQFSICRSCVRIPLLLDLARIEVLFYVEEPRKSILCIIAGARAHDSILTSKTCGMDCRVAHVRRLIQNTDALKPRT